MRSESLNHVSLQVEDVNETMSGAGDIIFRILILQRECDVQLSVQCSKSEGCVTGGKSGISKAPDPFKAGVVLFDPSAMKVCGIDERTVVVSADCKPFVNGALIGIVHSDDGLVQIHVRIPSADDPVLGIEDEKSADREIMRFHAE